MHADVRAAVKSIADVCRDVYFLFSFSYFLYRYNVIQDMYRASSSCPTGDATLTAISHSIELATEKEGDDYLVFVLSDANLGRYSISPADLKQELQADPKVTASILFIAEPNAAAWLSSGIPGQAHVVLDTAKLPHVIKTIFARAVE